MRWHLEDLERAALGDDWVYVERDHFPADMREDDAHAAFEALRQRLKRYDPPDVPAPPPTSSTYILDDESFEFAHFLFKPKRIRRTYFESDGPPTPEEFALAAVAYYEQMKKKRYFFYFGAVTEAGAAAGVPIIASNIAAMSTSGTGLPAFFCAAGRVWGVWPAALAASTKATSAKPATLVNPLFIYFSLVIRRWSRPGICFNTRWQREAH